MITIKNSFRRYSSLFRIILAAALLLAGLVAVPSVEATPLSLVKQQPDIVVSDLVRTGNVFGFDLIFTESDSSWFEAPPASGLSISGGTYLLDTFTGQFFIKGDTGTGIHELLAGKIIGYDLNGGNFYEFLIRIDNYDLALGNFGTRAGVIIASSGDSLNSDNFSTPVPEPSTIILLTAGLAGLVAIRRRRVR